MNTNILIDALPETVIVDGREFSINTDFRIGILFEQLLSSKEVPERNKFDLIMKLYFKNEIPDNVKGCSDAILDFYRCGKKEKKVVETTKRKIIAKKVSEIYDFDQDDSYIFSAYLDQYGIDLNDIELHWWKFVALFKGLKSDNEIVKIMEYRATDLSQIKNKEERERMSKLKGIYSLEAALTKEEKVARAGALFGGVR